MSDKDGRTEEATPQKKKQERKKGNIAKSKEVSTALTLGGLTLLILTMSKYFINTAVEIVSHFLNIDFNQNIDINYSTKMMLEGLFLFAKIFLPISGVILVLGVLGHVVQSGFLFSTESIKPKLSKLNPINGFKNMFSLKSLGQLIKSIIIITILLYSGYTFMRDNFRDILTLSNSHISSISLIISKLIYQIFFKISIIVMIVAILDLIYQKFNYKKQIRMTKQQIKDEYKENEGDPLIKSKIKQRQRQIAMSKMMNAVPDATVVLVNPTHISIAIKYDPDSGQAPIVVAKGIDNVAKRIREKAQEHDVPIIKDIELARSMYNVVEVNQEIPVEMYVAVSKILMVVLDLKNEKR